MTAVAVAGLVVGLVLMLAFESTPARVVGMTALAAFIVCGLFVIARPDFLTGDENEGD